jgi:transposase
MAMLLTIVNSESRTVHWHGWLLKVVEPVDMRRSFYGLYGVAKDVLEEDPQSGAIFGFLNKQVDYLKALYWSGDGFCLCAKRLERGAFERLRTHDGDGSEA